MLDFGTVAGEAVRQVSGGKRGDALGRVRSARQEQESKDSVIPDGYVFHFPEKPSSGNSALPAFPGEVRKNGTTAEVPDVVGENRRW
ncbi:hypothetical protein [Streptomyces sp. NPDC015125]|uniref:hypothetical protein n=1 Tax=Streptomyces sp. NPDC015125 TaxID=3364938 RepID=UPI0036FEB670